MLTLLMLLFLFCIRVQTDTNFAKGVVAPFLPPLACMWLPLELKRQV